MTTTRTTYEIHYTTKLGEPVVFRSSSSEALTQRIARDYPQYDQQRVERIMQVAKQRKLHPVSYRHDVAETVVWFPTRDYCSGYMEFFEGGR